MSDNEQLPQITNFLEKKDRLEIEGSLLKQETFKEIPPAFVEIVEQLRKLTRTWNPVELVTPSAESMRREKELFFAAFDKGNDYYPKFTYTHAQNINLDSQRAMRILQKALEHISAFRPENRSEQIAKVVLYYKVRDDLATAQLLKGLKEGSDEQIGKALAKKYTTIDDELVSIAEKMYQQSILSSAKSGSAESTELPTESELTELTKSVEPAENSVPLLSSEQQKLLTSVEMTAEETKTAFDWLLDEYGMSRTVDRPGFKTIISDEVYSIDVRDKSVQPMTIFIPKERLAGKMTGLKLLELMYHEIEGHARQSMNGRVLTVGGGELRVDEEVLYEGLAKRLDTRFHREFLGKKEGIPQTYYVFAVQMAEQGASFPEIFKDQFNRQLHKILKIPHDQPLPDETNLSPQHLMEAKNKAWKYTYRVMRGHIKTTNKEGYAFAKDLAYLRGYLLDKALVESGNGYINELAIMQVNALQLVAEIDFQSEDLPFPFLDLTKKYCFEVLLPKLEARQKNQQTT